MAISRKGTLQSLAHRAFERVLTQPGMNGAEVARRLRVSRQLVSTWRGGATPHDSAQVSIAELWGIPPSDWSRPDVVAGPGDGEPVAPEVAESGTLRDLRQALEDTLEDIETARSEEGSLTALSSLRTTQRHLLQQIAEAEEKAKTMRSRIAAWEGLQTFATQAAEVLRPLVGEQWPDTVIRLRRLWDEIDDETGKLPEGFRP